MTTAAQAAEPQATERSLASRITELVENDAVQLPPLPEVAMRVQEVLNSPSINMRELGSLLTRDPAIVAALLRLANSAAFGGLGRIEKLPVAVQRIGLRQVGAIVTALGLKEHFEHPSPEKRAILEVLWDHSVTSAFAARAIARRVGENQERAFLGGLLHDCGKILVLVALDRVEEEGLGFEPSRDLMIELMNELHGELGRGVLARWNLPDELAQVAASHDSYVEDADALLLSVQAANMITKKLGFHLEPDDTITLVGHPVMADLGLDDLTIATLMIDMEDHLAEMRAMF